MIQIVWVPSTHLLSLFFYCSNWLNPLGSVLFEIEGSKDENLSSFNGSCFVNSVFSTLIIGIVGILAIEKPKSFSRITALLLNAGIKP